MKLQISGYLHPDYKSGWARHDWNRCSNWNRCSRFAIWNLIIFSNFQFGMNTFGCTV